jgi:hypothetical protein
MSVSESAYIWVTDFTTHCIKKYLCLVSLEFIVFISDWENVMCFVTKNICSFDCPMIINLHGYIHSTFQ